ncbi:MAG TPA: 3'-5' exonuclease, partial [Candidatus Thermoplasmatota archaeon]|nr:3'-5' exonuclease [Candidatus Thermoplasmatota archaeon]
MTLRRLVALDLEPTGFNVYRDRIVEFCFIELDADLCELGRWTRRVNPGVPIPAAATAVHGIRDADVVHLPTLES